MNKKKYYIWQLAVFLSGSGTKMSAHELAEHLNRNSLLEKHSSLYQGRKATYLLLKKTMKWLHKDLKLQEEAGKVANVFVASDGSSLYDFKKAG